MAGLSYTAIPSSDEPQASSSQQQQQQSSSTSTFSSSILGGMKQQQPSQGSHAASSSSSSRWWYTAMLLLACAAGAMDWKMQRHLQVMTENVQGALRLAVFDLMENLQAYQYDMQAAQDEQEAHNLEQVAEQLSEKNAHEHQYAAKARARGQYLEKLAEMEERKGEDLMEQVQHNEELRQQVLQNLTLEEKQHEQTLNQLRDIHEGMCNWTLLTKMCDTVGGATGLQQRADREALQIQSEYRQVAALKRREKLQQMVAHMLQGKAAQFNATAAQLTHVADLWDAHAAAAQYQQEAQNMTHQAEVLEQEAEELEGQAAQAKELERLANLQAHQLLHAAQLAHVNAYWCAIVALLGGLVGLVFFVTRAAPRAKVGVEQWPKNNNNLPNGDNAAWWKYWSYCGLHLLFFGMILGMTGSYWLSLHKYTASQRAVILVWFAFLGATFQSFFLRALPRFMVEARSWEPNLTAFVLDLTLHSILLFLLFLIEALLAWIALGAVLFNDGLLGFFNSLLYCLVTVILSLVHVFYYDEQHQREAAVLSSTSAGGSVTVWADEQSAFVNNNNNKSGSSEELSEFTPLNKEQILSPGTTLDLNQYGNCSQTQPSSSEAPAGEPDWKTQFLRLILPFEVLMIASMVAVMRNSFFTLWHSQATLTQAAVFACVSALLVWGGILVKDLTCCDECYGAYGIRTSRPSVRSTGNSSNKSGILGKRPDAVELVQV